MTSSISDRVTDLIAEKAGATAADLKRDQTLEEIGLDSLHLMEIALSLRKEYGVVIAEGDLRSDQTVGATITYLAGRAR